MSSFGEELKRERELRQITLREISEATKISLRYLDALESNDFRHLPGGVFNKGFIRAYAQFIGVDAETMVNAYLLEERGQEARNRPEKGEAPQRPVTAGADRAWSLVLNPRASDRGSKTPGGWGRRRAWALLSVVLLLLAFGILAGILVIWLWKAPGPGQASPSSSDRGATVCPALDPSIAPAGSACRVENIEVSA